MSKRQKKKDGLDGGNLLLAPAFAAKSVRISSLSGTFQTYRDKAKV